MSISEQDRYELHEALRGAIGPKQAASLMASIPPTGWADVATKHDLRELEGRLLVRMSVLETRMGGLEERMGGLEERLGLRMEALEHRVLGQLSDRLRVQMQVMVAGLAGFAGVVIAAVRL